MNPSWPYASSSAPYMPYMPLGAMAPDTRNYFGQQEVTFSQPTFDSYQFSHGYSSGSSSTASLGEETFENQSPNQSNLSKKNDKWTNK